MEKGVDIISTILWPTPNAILRQWNALNKCLFNVFLTFNIWKDT